MLIVLRNLVPRRAVKEVAQKIKESGLTVQVWLLLTRLMLLPRSTKK